VSCSRKLVGGEGVDSADWAASLAWSAVGDSGAGADWAKIRPALASTAAIEPRIPFLMGTPVHGLLNRATAKEECCLDDDNPFLSGRQPCQTYRLFRAIP